MLFRSGRQIAACHRQPGLLGEGEPVLHGIGRSAEGADGGVQLRLGLLQGSLEDQHLRLVGLLEGDVDGASHLHVGARRQRCPPRILRLGLPERADRRTFLAGRTGAYTANGFYMRFKGWVAAAGLPPGLSPHGLRKATARRLAEGGRTVHQIAAVTGHKTLSEVERYTKAADQARLAREAMRGLSNDRG